MLIITTKYHIHNLRDIGNCGIPQTCKSTAYHYENISVPSIILFGWVEGKTLDTWTYKFTSYGCTSKAEPQLNNKKLDNLWASMVVMVQKWLSCIYLINFSSLLNVRWLIPWFWTYMHGHEHTCVDVHNYKLFLHL